MTFSDIEKVEEFNTSRPTLQEMSKSFGLKENDIRGKDRSTKGMKSTRNGNYVNKKKKCYFSHHLNLFIITM